MAVRNRRVLVACAATLAVVFVAGCSSSSASKDTSSTSTSTTTTTKPKPAATDATFDIVVTGDRPATITAAKGTCAIEGDATPQYSLTGATALGPDGMLSVEGETVVPGSGTVPASIKLVVGDAGFVSAATGAGITIKPNKKTVTLNADLTGGVSADDDTSTNAPDDSLRAHVSGTITCS